MKKNSLMIQVTILAVLLFFFGVLHSQAGIYSNFYAGGEGFTPSMFFNATLAPYVDSSPLQTYLIGDEDVISVSGIEVDTDNLTAVVGHYDSAFIDVSYSGQILVDIIPGGFGGDTYVYLPYTLQYQTSTSSYDSTDIYNLDGNLDFNWDAPGNENITISGQINVDGNISLFNFSQTVSWSGSGHFHNQYYPEGIMVDLSRTSSDNLTAQTIFDQTINGQHIEFQFDPRQFQLSGRLATGIVAAGAVPEPVSSTLFIIGGGAFAFWSFWKKRRKM